MATKTYKPVTPSLRFLITRNYAHLTTQAPNKSLTKGKKRVSGRSGASGRITVRRKGGGNKKLYREIDFKRDKYNVEAIVSSIEYDPNRTADICLLHYRDGEKRYIVAPRGVKVGDVVVSGENASPAIGNSLPLKNIPLGSVIHNVELTLNKGGTIVRSAGAYATLIAKEGDYVSIKLPSGEIRSVFGLCKATIGTVSGEDHMNTSLGKAGKNRWLGKRPKVRGVAMNPHDHPHGGGEGKTSGGRHPVSPWGQFTKGYKTRNKRNPTNKFIVKRRSK